MSYTSPIFSSVDLDQRSIDVDFGPAADDAGRMLGMLPTPDELMGAFPDYEASMPLYARDKWPDMIAAKDAAKAWPYRRITHPFDQDGEGTCVYNLLAMADQIMRNSLFGDHLQVPLSPISGYRWNASGPNTGSSVGGAIKWHEGSGLLPCDCEVNRANPNLTILHPAVGYRNSFKTGWQAQAKFFRADEWFRVSTVEGWVSAILNGFVCGGGRNSHAICHCGLAMDGGRILSIYANSWGQWGSTLEISTGLYKTFGFDSESLIRTMVSRDGWCLRTVLKPSWLRV